MKMKDVFRLPLDIHHDHIYNNVDDNYGRTIYTLSDTDDSSYKEAEYLIHAVNTHDQLQEEIEKYRDTATCAYCGIEMSKKDSKAVVAHMISCDKRPEKENALMVKLSELINKDLQEEAKHYKEVAQKELNLRLSLQKRLEAKNKVIRFANWVINTSINDGLELDAIDIQEKAVELELLYAVIATEKDVNEESEFEVGDTIYKPTEVLSQMEKEK